MFHERRHESFLKYKVWEYLRQSSLQTELSYKIRLSIIQYIMKLDNAMCLNVNVAITKLSNAIVPP